MTHFGRSVSTATLILLVGLGCDSNESNPSVATATATATARAKPKPKPVTKEQVTALVDKLDGYNHGKMLPLITKLGPGAIPHLVEAFKAQLPVERAANAAFASTPKHDKKARAKTARAALNAHGKNTGIVKSLISFGPKGCTEVRKLDKHVASTCTKRDCAKESWDLRREHKRGCATKSAAARL